MSTEEALVVDEDEDEDEDEEHARDIGTHARC